MDIFQMATKANFGLKLGQMFCLKKPNESRSRLAFYNPVPLPIVGLDRSTDVCRISM